MVSTEKINQLIEENQLEKALACIDERLAGNPRDDTAYYLKGKVFWKQGNWKLTGQTGLRNGDGNYQFF